MRKDSGDIVLDSDYVSIGLVKSGYLAAAGSLTRWRRTAINNPEMIPYPGNTDPIWSFTVKAVSPMVFIAGRAIFQYSVRSGDNVTFYYAMASTSVKYYVYDVMADRGPGAKLKLRNESGAITFDSHQIPLDVKGTASPPAPSHYNSTYLGYGVPYSGGSMSSSSSGNFTSAWCTYSVYIGIGNYAISLPWNRAASHTDSTTWARSIGASEGAYGNGLYCTFIFGTDAGASMNEFFQGSAMGAGPPAFFIVPVNRYPVATAIDITNLPFPFDIT